MFWRLQRYNNYDCLVRLSGFFLLWRNRPSGLGCLIVEVSTSHTFRHTHTHTHTHTHIGEDSSERVFSPSKRPVPAQHNRYNRRTSTTSAGFEPAIPVIERTQIYAWDYRDRSGGCLVRTLINQPTCVTYWLSCHLFRILDFLNFY